MGIVQMRSCIGATCAADIAAGEPRTQLSGAWLLPPHAPEMQRRTLLLLPQCEAAARDRFNRLLRYQARGGVSCACLHD